MAVKEPILGSPTNPPDDFSPLPIDTDERPPRINSLALWLAIGVFLILALRVFVYTPDDAFITFRYSRNVAEGFGPVFNRGGLDRTEGFSCPLFMFLMALLIKLPLGIDVLFRAKAIGLVCGALILVVSYRLAGLLRFPTWARSATPALLALHSSIVLTSVNGMETALQTLLVTLGACLCVDEWERRRRGETFGIVSALVFALAALNRPEGILFGLAAFAWMAVTTPGRVRAIGWRWLALFLAPVAAYLVFRHGFYGLWLPNTYYAKSVGLEVALEKAAPYLLRTFFWGIGGQYVLAGVGLIWWIAVLGGVASPRFFRAPGSLIPALAAMQILFVARTGDDGMLGWRFMAPVVPLLTLLAVGGAVALSEALLGLTRSRPRLLGNAIGLTACGLMALASLGGQWQYWQRDWDGCRSWASVGFTLNQRKMLDGWLMGMTTVTSDWLNRNIPAGSLIAYTEMGGTPYYSPQIRFLDANGLTDHGVATAPGASHWGNGVMDYYTRMVGVLGPYFRDVRKPDYIMQATQVPVGNEPDRSSILDGAYRFDDAIALPPVDSETKRYMLVWKRASGT